MQIAKTVKQLFRMINHHIGSGGEAHSPVTSLVAGFMTPGMYKNLEEIFTQRETIPAGTDILTLSPGFYEGGDILNHPDFGPTTPSTRISQFNVTNGLAGRKQIEVIDSFSNRRFTRTIHTDGTITDKQPGWAQIQQFTTLWSGNSTLENAVKLSAPIFGSDGGARFSTIEIRFVTTSGTTSMTSMSVNAQIAPLNVSALVRNPSLSINVYEANFELTSTTAKLSENHALHVFPKTEGVDDTARVVESPAAKISVLSIRGIA